MRYSEGHGLIRTTFATPFGVPHGVPPDLQILTMQTPTEQPVTMPDIGAGRWRVQVCSWLADLGEIVHEGDRLIEVSLPGMTFDVNAPADGRLISIDKSIGAEVQPGDVLGKLRPLNDD